MLKTASRQAETVRGVDMSALLAAAPRNCWLALDEERTKIVGRGENLKEALEEARKNGVGDPIMVWSPKSWVPIVLLT